MPQLSIQGVSRTFTEHQDRGTQALLNTGQIIFGIIVIGVIGVIGLVSDLLFKRLNRRLFAWSAL